MQLTIQKSNISKVFALLMLMMVLFTAAMPITAFASGTTPQTTTKSNEGQIAGEVSDIQVEMKNGKLVLGGLKQDNETAWNSVYKKYRDFITGVSGIGAITMVVLFIIQFMKLGASAGNPQARSQALTGVLWTGLAAAGLGAVTIITAFFYKAI